MQQLRSLPAKTMEALQLSDGSDSQASSERPSSPPPRGRATAQTAGRDPRLPGQPTGKATLSRVHQSPWLERLTQREEPQADEYRELQPSMESGDYRSVQTSRAVGQPQTPTPSQSNTSGSRSTSLVRSPRQGFAPAGEPPQPIRDPQPEPTTRSASLKTQDDVSSDSTSAPAKRFFPKQSLRSPIVTRLTDDDQPADDASSFRPADAASADAGTLDSGTLQAAPRVSRVPLPRASSQSTATAVPTHRPSTSRPSSSASQSSSMTSDGSSSTAPPANDSTSAPEFIKRVPAIPTSAAPLPGVLRISAATLQSAAQDSERTSVSVPTPLTSGTSLEQPSVPNSNIPPLPSEDAAADNTMPRSAGAQPAITSSALPQPEAAALPAPSVALRRSLSDDAPSLPAGELSDNVSSDLSPAAPAMDKSAAIPQPDPTSLEVPLPSLSSAPSSSSTPPMTSQSLPASPPTDAAPHNAFDQSSALRPPQIPKLVSDGTRSRVVTESTVLADQRLKMEAPHVQVLLNGPADIPIGTPANYEIVVRNDDAIDLRGLILRMDIPAGVYVEPLQPTRGQFESEQAEDGLTMLTWGFEHLPAGMTATAPMRLVASHAKNFAVAMEWTLLPISGTSQTQVTAPRLELALEGPAEVQFGQPNVYRLHIRNPGNAAARNVAVRMSAAPYGASTAEVSEVAPGEEEIVDVELTFNQRGTVQIKADAQAGPEVNSETSISVLVKQAVVEADMLATESVFHGSPAEFRIRLSNTGDADARELQANVQLPAGASLLSAPTGATLTGRDLSWSIPQLSAGETKDFPLQLKLASEGANVVHFACNGPGRVSASAQAATEVEAITDLKLFVNDPLAPAPVGHEVVYELMLTNRGSRAATNVKVIAQFSEGIEPVRGEGQAARIVTGQALFEPIARIGAGETRQLKVIAQAAASGVHRFRVEVRADETEVRMVQEETTQYLEGVSRLAAPPTNMRLR